MTLAFEALREQISLDLSTTLPWYGQPSQARSNCFRMAARQVQQLRRLRMVVQILPLVLIVVSVAFCVSTQTHPAMATRKLAVLKETNVSSNAKPARVCLRTDDQSRSFTHQNIGAKRNKANSNHHRVGRRRGRPGKYGAQRSWPALLTGAQNVAVLQKKRRNERSATRFHLLPFPL